MKREGEMKDMIRRELMHYAGTEVDRFYRTLWEVYRKVLMSGHSCATPLGKFRLTRLKPRRFTDHYRRIPVYVGARTSIRFTLRAVIRHEINGVEILDDSKHRKRI